MNADIIISPATQLSISKHLLAGGIGLAALFIGVGGWASTAEFAGAVITSGDLVVESDVKKVQHLTGGIVSDLRVKEGERVKAGDVLVHLDETVLQANRAMVAKAYDEAIARRARLEAERDGRDAIAFPADLTARDADGSASGLMAAERKLFDMRRISRNGQKSQLRERVEQLAQQVLGVEEQLQAKGRELTLINQELEGVRELWSKKLVPIQRVTSLERDLARLEGEKGHLLATIAQTKGKITETNLQVLQIDQDLRAEVGKELAELQSKISEYAERKVTADDQLKRVDIRSPQDGFVHQLAIHTVGGVVAPGEPIMMIVPSADDLTVEARIPSRDINQVHRGQETKLRFVSFNQRTTPELTGAVSRLSADQIADPKTGQSFYTVRIALSKDEFARLGTAKLTPGMPVEAFIQTQRRTVLSYLVKPLADQIEHAFRER